jgi:hypothetical protein
MPDVFMESSQTPAEEER